VQIHFGNAISMGAAADVRLAHHPVHILTRALETGSLIAGRDKLLAKQVPSPDQ
jgi:hypothetical protein